MCAGSHSSQKIHLEVNATFTSNQKGPGHVCESYFDTVCASIISLPWGLTRELEGALAAFASSAACL